MSIPAQEAALPLDDVMLAMDVVDTLRHQQTLVDRELGEKEREETLIARLREIYHQQGIEVPDRVLAEGVAALSESRFVYTPPQGGLGLLLARLYVTRGRWGPVVIGLAGAILVAAALYLFAYQPYVRAQAESARIELSEGLPARMDVLYKTIFDETKVQTAVRQADELRARGKSAATEGDRPGAEKAVNDLTALRDLLRQQYSLKIVNRDGVKSGFWTFPDINSAATNYYLVVEAVTAEGKALQIPITNEEDGTRETVSLWGVRVPESVYRTIEADKRDNGIIEHDVVGLKQFGYLDTDYLVPVLGGTVTRW